MLLQFLVASEGNGGFLYQITPSSSISSFSGEAGCRGTCSHDQIVLVTHFTMDLYKMVKFQGHKIYTYRFVTVIFVCFFSFFKLLSKDNFPALSPQLPQL